MNSTICLTILLFFFQVFILFPQINTQCAENIYTNKNFLTCSTNHKLDSSMNEFPSFLKTSSYTKLSLEIIFNPISTCDNLSSTKNLFIMTVQDSSGQEMKAVNLAWFSGGNYLIHTSMGASQSYFNLNSATPFAENKDLEVVATIDFDNKIWNAGVNIPGLYSYYGSDTAVSFFSSAFKFDANTKFYFCSHLPSDYSGASFHCSIRTFNIWYTFQYASSALQYFGALSPVYVAYYRMDEGNGYSIQDSTGTLPAGSLGIPAATNAPKWSSSTVGVEFTSVSQYIELPVFPTTASGNPLTSHSFTISFWFKFNMAWGTAKIFRYTTAALDYDNFGLYIDSTGKLTIGMANLASTQTSPLLLSSPVWTLITASYSTGSLSSPGYNPYELFQDGTLTALNLAFSPSLSPGPYRVIIGGSNSFLGAIAHLRILSPASNSIHDLTKCSSSSSTPTYFQCALNLDMTNPKTCVSYPCGGPNCDRCSGGSTYDSCLSCSSTYEYSKGLSLCNVDLTPPVSPVIKPAQTATSTLSKVYSALTKGSSSGFSAAVAGKIFSNIKYLDIGYSLELQKALKSWQSSFISMGLDLDPPQGLQDKIPELGVPPTFEKYEVSSDFLINFWEGIVVLMIVAGLFGVIRAVEYLSKESKSKTLLYVKKSRYMIQNLLYSQLYGVFGDVVMYSVLNYRSQNLGEGLASLGFIVSALLLIITAMILAFGLDLLVQYQQLKTNKNALEELLERSQGSSLTFQDFKDTSLFKQSFLFLLVLRDFLFSLILTTLFQHPLAQTILILLLNLAIIAILFIKQPFKERFAFLQQIFYEIVTLAVNIAVIILASKDQADSTAYDLRESTGKLIIITNLVFNFTVIAFLLCGLFMTFKEAYQEYKAKKVEKISRIPVDSQLADSSFIHIENRNQTKISKKRRGIGESHNRMDNSFQPDHSIEPEDSDSSFFQIPQTKNQFHSNNFRFPHKNRRDNSKRLARNNPLVQNNSPNKILNQPYEAQNQQKQEIQDKNYSLASLVKASKRRHVRARPNVQNRELEMTQNIRGRNAFKK